MHNDIDRDLYEILGVAQGVSSDEIKSAYRGKARECHPDVAQHDLESEEKFKELTFAYEVLSDPEKRRTYDAFGLDGLRRGAGIDASGFGSISDLFDMFFGNGYGFSRQRPARGGKERGRDMEMLMTVSLDDVLSGLEKDIEHTRMATCSLCDGSGMKPGARMNRCAVCQGTGDIRKTQRNVFGTFIRSQPCPTCAGQGEVVTDPCQNCEGAGRERITEKLRVSMPPGVERQDRIRIKEKGEGGARGGPSGDLYVVIDVASDDRFERNGKHLYTCVEVGMIDAALGAEIDMKVLDGTHKLKVPAGVQPDDVLKIKGKGLPPRYGGRRGDIFVRVRISVPKQLTGKQRNLLESYRESEKAKASK
ncbi:MAG: molecular chaperone DnaJ [Candidatus Anoxymicrobium japonicum]|uniref:Chaperone protein DnaJ n=1 Tax=Candidatus Anoxymicrobium japonicum TaxID=2013648 RepID=A0A2N3G7B6_9ACTN|nr:MAG: molecular chaperone DnaJ [Candidatus Anoxymicrobium japonicum]